MKTQKDKKIEKFFVGEYRKSDQPINVSRVIRIAKKINKLEEDHNRAVLSGAHDCK